MSKYILRVEQYEQMKNLGRSETARFVIKNIVDDQYWDGKGFTSDLKKASLYASTNIACMEIQDFLKTIYGGTLKHEYKAEVVVEVYGNISEEDLAVWLHQASSLRVMTSKYGNGPGETLAIPHIRWGTLKKTPT